MCSHIRGGRPGNFTVRAGPRRTSRRASACKDLSRKRPTNTATPCSFQCRRPKAETRRRLLHMARNRRVARVLLAAHVAFAWTATVLAHHSSAMYDNQRTVTLRGVVTEFRWTNPHVTMTIATDPQRELWIVEATSPGNLTRAGWTRTSMRVGDRVEVTA